MNYTIYKVTNLIDGKYYIGKHQTKDLNDGYMGSGKLIRRAIRKHGKENFKKEILFVFDNEAEMNAKEAELVVICDESYNLCDGGKGGWSYINRNEDLRKEKNIKAARIANDRGALQKANERRKWLRENDPEWAKADFETRSRVKKGNQNWLGKQHSDETKKKMSEAKKGKPISNRASQKGKIWITNGIKNSMVANTGFIPEGWYRGITK